MVRPASHDHHPQLQGLRLRTSRPRRLQGRLGVHVRRQPDGTILVEKCSYRAGFDPTLRHRTRKEVPYGTGALVAWDGGARHNGTLILKDDDFEWRRAAATGRSCRSPAGASCGSEGANRFVAGQWPVALQFDPLREDARPSTRRSARFDLAADGHPGTVRKGDQWSDAALQAHRPGGAATGR
jgi:hypothetical protein